MISVEDVLRRPDLRLLRTRMESLRQSVGAWRLGVARRLFPRGVRSDRGEGPAPFEVLAAVGEGVAESDAPEALLPLEAFHEMLSEGRPLDVGAERFHPRWGARLERWGATRLLGWPLPSDRLPTVLFVALYRGDRRPGEQRLQVGRQGMEALARALTPPTWLPVAPAEMVGPACGGRPVPLEFDGEDLEGLRRELPRLAASALPVLIEARAGCGAQLLMREILDRGETGRRGIQRFEGCRGEDLIACLQRVDDSSPAAVVLHAAEQLTPRQQTELERLLRERGPRSRSPRLFTLASSALWPEVERQTLRQDLYWRLAALRVHLPPLAGRGPDIARLFRRAWAEARAERGLGDHTLRIARDTMPALLGAAWPGNLDQLRREASRIADVYPDARRLRIDMLSPELRRPCRDVEATLQQLLPLDEAVAAVEELMIRRALRVTEGNKADAARRLRLSRQGLYRKLRRYGILVGPGEASQGEAGEALDSRQDSA